MLFWFLTVIATWLLLSVVVSLGLARAISLSGRGGRSTRVSAVPVLASVANVPAQRGNSETTTHQYHALAALGS